MDLTFIIKVHLIMDNLLTLKFKMQMRLSLKVKPKTISKNIHSKSVN